MRILGIDCGSQATGYGVLDSDGRTYSLVAAGVIRTSNGASLADRLCTIYKRLAEVLAEFRPETVAVEEVFHAVNVSTALKLAHVRGVALLVAAQASLPVGEYSPLEVKTSVVGYGRAEKHQVQGMVASLLALDEPAPEDASDALAVAICHATHAVLPR